MGTVDHDLLPRLLARCEEVATEAGMKPTIVLVYHDVVQQPAQTYLTASGQVKDTDSALADKAQAAGAALESLDAPYREARSVVAAYLPALKLPATLKTQPTDTDQSNAIKGLRGEIIKHVGKPWADELLKGPFGQRAPVTIDALDASIAAAKASSAAHQQRATAFDPAYDAFGKFKQVVRDGLGSKSKQYQRLRVRRNGASDAEEGTPKPPVTQGASVTAANGTGASTGTGTVAKPANGTTGNGGNGASTGNGTTGNGTVATPAPSAGTTTTAGTTAATPAPANPTP